MATDMENDSALKECPDSVVKKFATELEELFNYRDLFFVYNPVEMAVKKNTIVEEKRDALLEKFEAVDVDTDIPAELRAEFLYLKGRCYNIVPNYEPKAVQCLSRAVKLNPRMVQAWNELGECYWKNLNIKDAKFSFEGALQHERNRVSLRCLSIILRQEVSGKSMKDAAAAILKSVEYAKEAVSQEYKDGLSWSILGNAYLCQYFMVAQHPTTLKLCMSAYKQAYQDPIARGQPDLYYNKGIALKYEECYPDAVESFETACRLDPPWHPPKQELNKLMKYLNGINDLVRTKGKIKPKKLGTMVKAIDERMLGCYGPGSVLQIGKREKVTLTWVPLSQLKEGTNEGLVVAAVVLGSIHSHNSVPFTFAVTDNSGQCFSVTVYNWANGRGAIIGDVIAIPEPIVKIQQEKSDKLNYDFKAIRVNNPTTLVMNGRKVGRNQFACTKVTSTCELLLRSGLNGVVIE